jgi:hypothetical protein
MKIQDLITKITDLNISLWDAPSLNLVIKNNNDEEVTIKKIKVDKDQDTIFIHLK